MRKLSKATSRALAITAKAATRLFYATDDDSGELGHLRSVSFTGARYDVATSLSGYQHAFQRDAGELTFEIELPPDLTGLGSLGPASRLFDMRQLVEWTLEMPNSYTWGFKGFVSSVETTLCMVRCCTVKVKVAGPVTCYSDVEYVEVLSGLPVFDKKSSKAQAVTYAHMLQLVTQPTTAPAPPTGYVEGDWVEPVEYEDYERD